MSNTMSLSEERMEVAALSKPSTPSILSVSVKDCHLP